MEIYIVLALLLALFQSWLIPMAINIQNLQWMMGARDSSPSESVLLKRARRASLNLHESLAPFLALVLASMYIEIDWLNYLFSWDGISAFLNNEIIYKYFASHNA